MVGLPSSCTESPKLSRICRRTSNAVSGLTGEFVLEEGCGRFLPSEIGLCVAMDQKLTLSNLLSRMPLICGESLTVLPRHYCYFLFQKLVGWEFLDR